MDHSLHFKITGMHCVSCAPQLEQAISSIEGVKRVQINFVNEKATIEVESISPKLTQNILNSIKEKGYGGELISNRVVTHHHGGENTPGTSYLDLGVAIVFSLPLAAHMVGLHIPHPISNSSVPQWSNSGRDGAFIKLLGIPLKV